MGPKKSDRRALLDVLFASYGGLENPDFQERITKNKPLVERFVKETGHKLLEVRATMENGDFEPAYTFDDGSGMRYTIEGIKESLVSRLYETKRLH